MRELAALLRSPGNLIFFRAQTQYNNLGDLIINRVLINQLRSVGTLLVDVREVPDWYCQQLELTDIELSNQYRLKFNYLIFFAAVRLLLSGGKRKVYLISSPGHRYGSLSAQQIKVYLVNILHYAIFWLVGVRICSFGVSIGPFSRTWEILERWRSKLFAFYSVRDSISEKYAHQIGIPQVTRFPDLAWLLDPPPQDAIADLSHRNYVVFSFRAQTDNTTASSDYQQSLYRTLDAIADQVCQTWSKQLVVFYQVQMDQAFCCQLADRYQSRHNVVFIEERVDLPTMQRVYDGAFMVFSNRLHVLMLALIFGSIPIAVIDTTKHSKITGIFHDADLLSLAIDVAEGASSLSKLTEVAENASNIRRMLTDRYTQTREQANALFRQVMTEAGVGKGWGG